MYRVHGKVLAKETGSGIHNLVVAIFDRDTTPPTTPTTPPLPSAAPLAGQETLERIGSVITDAAGSFELTFETDAFAAGDPERRPDLVLAVYAPEDCRGLDQPTSLPPEQRLLLSSNIHRLNAGKNEAYVLRIPQNVLEKFGIPFRAALSAADTETPARRRVAAKVSAEELKARVREGLAPLRRGRLRRHKEIAAASKKFVAKLGATPLALRNRPTFVGSGRDFGTAQREAMGRGLAAQKTIRGGRPLLYHVDQQELHFVAPDTPWAEIPPVIELTHEQMCELFSRRRGGTALERVLDLAQARKREADGRRRIAEATSGEGSGQADAEGSGGQAELPSAPAAPEEVLTSGVLGQLRDLTAPEAAPAASIEELSARLTGFSLPPGPADVTSFHDFHQLQIAFEHVWTEAFDEGLRSRVRDLYNETVRLHDDWGVEQELPEEVAERESLELFFLEMRQELDVYTAARELFESMGISVEETAGTVTIGEEGSQVEIAPPAGSPPLPVLGPTRLSRLLRETEQRLAEPYAFHYFAPGQTVTRNGEDVVLAGVNFGILVTYRQKWEPLTYQVGDLVGTIPLAPGESRNITTRTVVKRTRAQKEIEKALSSRSGESTLTQRADAEIVARASATTNFRQTAQGSFDIGIGSLEASAEFVLNQAQESARTKKDFREAVVKAAQEYKQERTLELETTQEATVETTTSGAISNVNNEMTVTYLLYELERQYRISERIHRVTPVILVAQDVPGPHEITESWLLAHEWILRRVLLDDRLQPALDQLSEAFAGDELSVQIKRLNWETRKGIVEKLEGIVTDLKTKRDSYRAALLEKEEAMKLAKAADDAEGFMLEVVEGLSADLTGAAVDFLKAGVAKVQKQLEFLQESLAEEQQKLTAAQEALDSATKAYTAAIETQTNRRVAIDQLRVHVKANILYYMQAIWDHEPPDQRFFRLYYQVVDLPEAESEVCRLRRATEEELARGVETIWQDGDFYVVEGCEAPVLPDPDHPNTKKLVEIADLDHPLGYKGNYIIFPLKTCVYLTEFMMKQYIDGYFGVRDPDESSNFTTDELLTHLEAIWNDPDVTLSEAERTALRNLVLNRVREPRRESDVVVVPTGQIYIEALLGSHPLLEPFKRIHRAYDVGKARAELRKAELDNLRRAARLLKDEPDLEDPDVDKRVVVDGIPRVIVNPD